MIEGPTLAAISTRTYSSIYGYTEGDLGTVFAPDLDGVDRERVREWYNGL